MATQKSRNKKNNDKNEEPKTQPTRAAANKFTYVMILSIVAGIIIIGSGIYELTLYSNPAFLSTVQSVALNSSLNSTLRLGSSNSTVPLTNSTMAGIMQAAIEALVIIAILQIVFGAVIAVLGYLLSKKQNKRVAIGVTILILSIISILMGGGFFIGPILGIIAGVLALIWKN